MSQDNIQSDITARIAGDPGTVGLALFTVAALYLGITLCNLVPNSSAMVGVPILLASGTAQLIFGALSVRRGDHIMGLFFGVFGPFLISFGLLSWGLVGKWWPVPPADIAHDEAGFLLAWTVLLSLWLVLSVLEPLILTVTLAIVVAALWAFDASLWSASTGLQHTAGWLLIAATAAVLYLVAAGWCKWVGIVLPKGRPLVELVGPRRSMATGPSVVPEVAV